MSRLSHSLGRAGYVIQRLWITIDFVIVILIFVGIGEALSMKTAVARAARVSNSQGLASQDLSTQVALLRNDVEHAQDEKRLIFIVLGFIGVTSVGPWFVTFLRDSKAQSRAESANQPFLEGSGLTLTLVNDVLTLARDATERLAKEAERRAQQLAESAESEAMSIFADVAGQDPRVLLEDSERRSRLRTLAGEIASFEASKLLTQVNVQIKPHAMFIRGMAFYLEQQFTEAIQCWTEIANNDDTGNKLRSLAWYWVGYEHNNLGKFESAERDFAAALDLEENEARQIDLRRIAIETQFFRHGVASAETLIGQLTDLLSDADHGEFAKVGMNVRILLGNVLYATAIANQGTAEETDLLDKARRNFESAQHSSWARFGLAQCLQRVGETEKAERLYRSCRADAISEFENREEARTKARAKVAELMCCINVSEFNGDAEVVYGQLLNKLEDGGGRLWVYSPISKRNVQRAKLRWMMYTGDVILFQKALRTTRERRHLVHGAPLSLYAPVLWISDPTAFLFRFRGLC